MGIVDEWNDLRSRYENRYRRYLKRWHEYHNEDDRGHANECCYVLLNIFGLTPEQVNKLEEDYCGLTHNLQ